MSGLIQSFSGLAVDCLHLKPEQVRYEDIPHALAQKVRFNGHLREMGYSVAQHCVLGAEQMKFAREVWSTYREKCELQLAFLLHEVSEVYLPDVPAPIKAFLRVMPPTKPWPAVDLGISWAMLEYTHATVMLDALGLKHLLLLLDSPEVKLMDRRMLVTEKRDLRLHEVDPQIRAQELARHGTVEPLPISIDRVWGPQEAKKEFNDLYLHLRRELAKS